MKNFLYKFEFTSGFYENFFYQQIKAKDEKSALIEVISNFKNIETSEAEILIQKRLTNDDENFRNFEWTIEEFWEKTDRKFFSQGDQECFYLLDLKEINFDLDKL